jgi:hypothetical protein
VLQAGARVTVQLTVEDFPGQPFRQGLQLLIQGRLRLRACAHVGVLQWSCAMIGRSPVAVFVGLARIWTGRRRVVQGRGRGAPASVDASPCAAAVGGLLPALAAVDRRSWCTGRGLRVRRGRAAGSYVSDAGYSGVWTRPFRASAVGPSATG